MECNVCFERYDATERRPKVLPCGHSFCVKCLQGLRPRRCPADNKVFKSPEELVDNFSLLQASSKPVDAASPRFWCLQCQKEATALCVDEHPVCNLKKARADAAAPVLEDLQQDEVVVDKLGEALEVFRELLQREKASLVSAQGRLRDAEAGDAAAWEQAKKDAVDAGLSRSVAELLNGLGDPATSCSLTVHRGAAGGEAGGDVWSGQVRPAEDAAAGLAAGLLMFRLARCGALERLKQQQATPPKQLRPAAPQWTERSNEGQWEMTVEEMASGMEAGAKVARGRDWLTYKEVGEPPGRATVVSKTEDGMVSVVWDQNKVAGRYRMGFDGRYDLRLLPSPLMAHIGAKVGDVFIDAKTTSSTLGPKNMSLVLTSGALDKARFIFALPCSVIPFWSQKVLELLAPRLEGLHMLDPLQRHLDVALGMPHLQALSITGVTGEQLKQVSQMASLRRLELHCTLAAPLPVLSFPAVPAGLLWLRCGVHPLATALALVRAHAATLEELQLVAASTEPYGCPDLAAELRHCQLKKLKRMVLLRQTVNDATCRHGKEACRVQTQQLWDAFVESHLDVHIVCSVCDRAEFQKSQLKSVTL